MSRLCLLVLLLANFALPVQAQQPAQVIRPPETRQNLLALARTMGAVHYLNVVCHGRQTQDWRDRMVELLELENPDYRLRAQLIATFNRGYREQEQLFSACTGQVADQIKIKAKQGRILSDALGDPYLQ